MSKMKAVKRKAQCPILEAVHETADGFHRFGVIDKCKMQEFDALCLDLIPDYDRQLISGFVPS